MNQRLTLNRLMSYLIDMTKKFETDENNYELSKFKHDLIDSKFETLEFGEVCNLGGLPKRLQEIFDPFLTDMKRVGVIESNEKKNNISLLYSLLYCIKSDFLDISNDKKINCVDELNTKMLTDFYSNDLFKKYGYADLGWQKKEIEEALLKYKNNMLVLRFLADYFNINIFLMSVNEDKIYAVYPEEHYIMFKPSLILSFCDGVFEPITFGNVNLWKYTDEPLRKLINVDKKLITVLNVDFTSKDKDGDQEVIMFEMGSNDLTKFLPKDYDPVNEIDDNGNGNGGEGEEDEDDDDEEEDNNYDEVYDKNPETEIFIDDHEDTEIDVETQNDGNIFYVNDSYSDGGDDNKGNDSNGCNDLENDKLISTISLKLKASDMRKIAKKFNIKLSCGKFKNGKDKMKTKEELYTEIVNKIKGHE
jgi:hypothetical protein